MVKTLSNTAAMVFALSLLTSAPAVATTYCVATPQQLRDALHSATYPGGDATIYVVRGLYRTDGTPFSYPGANHALNIIGGYNSTCTARKKNPALTVLDGGGTSVVFIGSSPGAFAMRYLTVQNGYNSTPPSAAACPSSARAMRP